VEVAVELARALDDERGGDLSRSLRQLYTYVLEQVNEGNARQEDRCFANAENVVVPLAEAWQELSRPSSSGDLPEAALPCWSGDADAVASLSYSG
jgi:flagellin-specific chaperone FliS